MYCGWEGNRRSGITLAAMRRTPKLFIRLQAQGLTNRDEHHHLSILRYGTLIFTVYTVECCRGVVVVVETQQKVVVPQLSKPLKSSDAPEGTSLLLECYLTGIPYPTVSWFKVGSFVDYYLISLSAQTEYSRYRHAYNLVIHTFFTAPC